MDKKPAAIVAAARSWVGTRFHHQGRLKKTDSHNGGVDCLGLLIGVARELGLKSAMGIALAECDSVEYSRHPDGIILKNKLDQLLMNIEPMEMGPGDIALINFNGNPQHLGIITDYRNDNSCFIKLGIIHAYAQARKVVEHILDEEWRKRIVAVYRLRD